MTKEASLIPIISKVYKEFTPHELVVWRQFLPTTYEQSTDKWSKYCFDEIPSSVLEVIEMHTNSKVFDSLQIWTPEKAASDPMLVGVLESKFFPLARWGESLKEFSEIEELNMPNQISEHSLKDWPASIKKFLLEKYREKPWATFDVYRKYLTWHCLTPTYRVIVHCGGTNTDYRVCGKCGSWTKGKNPYIPFYFPNH